MTTNGDTWRIRSNIMTLEEAIEHAKDVALHIDCLECARDHQQLVEWLEELKARRGRTGIFVQNKV